MSSSVASPSSSTIWPPSAIKSNTRFRFHMERSYPSPRSAVDPKSWDAALAWAIGALARGRLRRCRGRRRRGHMRVALLDAVRAVRHVFGVVRVLHVRALRLGIRLACHVLSFAASCRRRRSRCARSPVMSPGVWGSSASLGEISAGADEQRRASSRRACPAISRSGCRAR